MEGNGREGIGQEGTGREAKRSKAKQRKGKEKKEKERKRKEMEGKGREGKGREGKQREGKERKGKGRKGKERKGKERKGKETKGMGRDETGRDGTGRKGKERKGKERKGKERKGKERKGKKGKGMEGKGKEENGWKGKERKGKERKGKERKGKERKGKERKGRGKKLKHVSQDTVVRGTGCGSQRGSLRDQSVEDEEKENLLKAEIRDKDSGGTFRWRYGSTTSPEIRSSFIRHFIRHNGVGIGPLVPVKGTLNASAYQDILDNFMLPTLWEQFGDDPFLFQHDCTPVTKARSIKTWMREFGVEELARPAQSPDLNPIEHLWDELERRLRARPSCPTSAPDLTNVLLEERSNIPINTLLNLVESLPKRVEAVIAAKGGTTPYYIHAHVKADVPKLLAT
ncbi:hypothetical protein QTP70_007607 [Hemibagrus guttatus]|uniref:Tc1-like transposase DDE domain-containing protein n=1 Tax=Hemibagrus guttatus TaxID=175788 RepID=A0AAE0RGN1_9TELE|nr:hypothetical protein QTP70_007607 [Hemibagrus guttatus]